MATRPTVLPTTPPGPSATVLDFANLRPRDLAAWRELAAAAIEPNPFFEPELVLPAARHLREPEIGLAVVTDADGWVAAMPIRRRTRWRRVPGACVTTWGHTHCFLDTPLVHERAPAETIPALLEAVLSHHHVGYLVFEQISAGPVQDAIHAALAERGTHAITYATGERATLVRREAPTYTDHVGSKRRRELRRQWRLLEEELGEPLTITERAGDEAAYAAFLDLEAAGWKGEAGTAFHNVAGHGGFALDLMREFDRQDRLELQALHAGERTIAMKCNVLSGDGVFCFKIAHDESLARFSPGVQLELRYIDVFHERGAAAWADSCAAPDNAMINRLWPDRRTVSTIVVPAVGARGAIGATAIQGVVQLRRRLGRAA